MLGMQDTGSPVQIASSTVVTKSFPEAENLLLVGLGQGGNIGKGMQKTLEEWNDGRDLCLLQHDLADPNGIGIARPPPGQIAGMASKPRQQTAANPGAVLGHEKGMCRHESILEDRHSSSGVRREYLSRMDLAASGPDRFWGRVFSAAAGLAASGAGVSTADGEVSRSITVLPSGTSGTSARLDHRRSRAPFLLQGEQHGGHRFVILGPCPAALPACLEVAPVSTWPVSGR